MASKRASAQAGKKEEAAKQSSSQELEQELLLEALQRIENETDSERAQKEQRKLAQIFENLINSLHELDQAYLQESYPRTAANVRTYSIKAIEALRQALATAVKAGKGRLYSGFLSLVPEGLPLAGLEALAVELAEVNAGKKSALFSPNSVESAKVRLSVRAAAAAALHVLVENQLAPVEIAAEKISEVLFKASIFRIDAETHQRLPIPVATIIDWRKDRDTHSPEYRKLFMRSKAFIGDTLLDDPFVENPTAKKTDIALDLFAYLVKAFNFS